MKISQGGPDLLHLSCQLVEPARLDGMPLYLWITLPGGERVYLSELLRKQKENCVCELVPYAVPGNPERLTFLVEAYPILNDQSLERGELGSCCLPRVNETHEPLIRLHIQIEGSDETPSTWTARFEPTYERVSED